MSAQTQPAKNDKAKPANGNAPVNDAKPTMEASAPGTPDAEEKKVRGIIPTMPACILYRLGGKVTAAIHHPVDGTSYSETGKGEGSAKGALEDAGYRLGMVVADGHEWIRAKLPAGAELIGYASIKGFPLLPQEK